MTLTYMQCARLVQLITIYGCRGLAPSPSICHSQSPTAKSQIEVARDSKFERSYKIVAALQAMIVPWLRVVLVPRAASNGNTMSGLTTNLLCDTNFTCRQACPHAMLSILDVLVNPCRTALIVVRAKRMCKMVPQFTTPVIKALETI
jgi:hypothetical protein